MAEKQLESTVRAAAFQKEWFGELRRRVFDERQAYALVQADVPFELFDLLDIPAVSNQWWSSLVAAKRQAPAFLDAMSADGVPDQLCRYCSLGLATTRYSGAGEAPWGGLPTPRLLCARLTCDCVHRVFSLWAEAFGAELFEIDHPGATELPPRWWELGRASMARARGAASARIRRGNARAARRKARSDQRAAPGPRGAAREARAREPTGRDFRRGTQADRVGSGDARAHDGANRERDGHPMGSRHGLGARARGAFPRRDRAARRRRRRGVRGRETQAHVGRSRTLARHGFLYGLRGIARRRLRLVDVSRLRPRRLHPLRLRRSDRGAREPDRELQRVPAQSAVGGRVDRRAGARASHRRRARAAPEEHEALRDRAALHRARARGSRHSDVADRSGRRRRARLGSGGDARGGAPFLDERVPR